MNAREKHKHFLLYHQQCFVSLLSVLLCKGLGFVQSVYLKHKERIIPYAISMVFFFWAFYVLKTSKTFLHRPNEPWHFLSVIMILSPIFLDKHACNGSRGALGLFGAAVHHRSFTGIFWPLPFW